jgi:hypothetical protein
MGSLHYGGRAERSATAGAARLETLSIARYRMHDAHCSTTPGDTYDGIVSASRSMDGAAPFHKFHGVGITWA